MSDPKPKRFEGFVAIFYPEKFYGFITQDVPGTSSSSGIYFGARDIRPDWRGSTAHAWTPGTPVSYLLVKRPSKKFAGTWTAADDVYPLFTDEIETESLETYGETSCVLKWNGRYGELLREDGDTLFFHKASVLDRFEGRLVNLSAGDYVYHGVGTREDGRWHAVDIELFSEAEQARLQQGLSAQEPESEPEPEPQPAPLVAAPELTEDSLLAPARRNTPIIQLILEKRAPKKEI
jgi:hypothetical protein